MSTPIYTNITPAPPPAPLAPAPPLKPIWSTTVCRQGAIHSQLGQTVGKRGAPQETKFTRIDYDPNKSDLVRHLLMFRAFHGYWEGRNCAIVEYETPSGEKRYAIGVSSGTHSEEKLLLFLQALKANNQLGRVTRVYSERQPCNGCDSGNNCDHLLKTSPLMKGATVEWSFDYKLIKGPKKDEDQYIKQEELYDTQRAAHRKTANSADWNAQASAEQGAPGAPFVHVLPPVDAAFDRTKTVGVFDNRGLKTDPRTHPEQALPPQGVLDSARAFSGARLRFRKPPAENGDGT
jgi:hypothetical protein